MLVSRETLRQTGRIAEDDRVRGPEIGLNSLGLTANQLAVRADEPMAGI